jgi:solute carrier family 6 (neurotransmitter transporter, dopamine) member 3
MVGRIVLCTFICYIGVYFSTWKGIKSSATVAYVTVPLPYIMLTILLIKGISLEGAGKGLKFLFVPDWSKLGKLKVWEDAVVQIAYSSGISFGPLMLYGSARQPEEPLVKSCIILPLINSASSIYAAITIFSFLGHISVTNNIPIEDISDGGLDLAFIAYPGLLSLLTWPNFWSFLFFLMLLTVGIDSIFGIQEFALVYTYEIIPNLHKKVSREIFVLGVTCTYFLIALIFCTESGYWMFNLFNYYSAGLTLVFLMIVEAVMIAWVFGIDKLEEQLHKRNGEKFPMYIKYMVKFFAPFLMFVILCIGFYNEFKSNQLDLPLGYMFIARGLLFVPLLCCLIGVFYKLPGTPKFEDLK